VAVATMHCTKIRESMSLALWLENNVLKEKQGLKM
jgi:metal-dependent hydrolase (beta-lactamase superfamily II)